MRPRPRHHTRGPAWAVNLGNAPMAPAPVQTFALELPIEQRATLVFLRKLKDGPDSAAGQVMRRLDADKVAFGKWAELRSEGYVTHEPKLGGHRLTPKGHHASNDIIKDFCFRYSIHVFTLSGGRGSGGGTWSRCSCGTWSTGPHNNDRYGESRLRTAQSAHIRDVDSGVWPTRTLTDFLNKVDPLTLDLRQQNMVQATIGHGEAPSRSPEQLEKR